MKLIYAKEFPHGSEEKKAQSNFFKEFANILPTIQQMAATNRYSNQKIMCLLLRFFSEGILVVLLCPSDTITYKIIESDYTLPKDEIIGNSFVQGLIHNGLIP